MKWAGAELVSWVCRRVRQSRHGKSDLIWSRRGLCFVNTRIGGWSQRVRRVRLDKKGRLTPIGPGTPSQVLTSTKQRIAIRANFRVTCAWGGTTGCMAHGAYVPAAVDWLERPIVRVTGCRLVLCHSQNLTCGKGVRRQLPERPCGCFAQLTPDPFATPSQS